VSSTRKLFETNNLFDETPQKLLVKAAPLVFVSRTVWRSAEGVKIMTVDPILGEELQKQRMNGEFVGLIEGCDCQ
jgi:hypothetical protein